MVSLKDMMVLLGLVLVVLLTLIKTLRLRLRIAPGADNNQLKFFTGGSIAAMFDLSNQANFYGNVDVSYGNLIVNAIASNASPSAANTYDLGTSSQNWRTLYVDNITSDDQVIKFDTTGALVLPSGTEAQRPTEQVGMLRFNNQDARFEGYDGTAWAWTSRFCY